MALTVNNRIALCRNEMVRPKIVAPILIALVFLALPGSLEHKAHMALHGLCAQQPAHTYRFGDRLLPFDARMTGIYSGYLVTTALLVLRGAHRWCRPPSMSRLVLLAGLGGVMVLDGANSFLADVGASAVYEPRNWLRLITGTTAGVVLGFALCFLMASSLWQSFDTCRETLQDWRIIPLIGLVWAPLGLAIWSGYEPLYVPLTLMLLFAAMLALTTLALVVLVLLRRRDFSFVNVDSLGGYGLGALGAAGIMMGALAAGRWLLERSIAGAPLT